MKKSILYILFSLFFHNLHSQKKMITPPFLQQGDTVAIVSTARKNIEDNLKPTIAMLEGWGLKVKLGKTIGLDHYQLAGTDDQRAEDFQEQMDNPNIKAIWCVRGGYGTVRIIDKLDFTKFKQNPKWIIGFSDVTVLHSHLNRMGFQSIHGIMPVSVARATDEAKNSLCTALFGDKLEYELDCDALNHVGKAKGELVGGNLSLLAHLIGSESFPNPAGKILFIEEIGERLYHVDRMLVQLKRAGYLSQLSGLIIGGFTDCEEAKLEIGKTVEELVLEHCAGTNYPIAFNFPAGHIPNNFALPFGTKIKFLVNAEIVQVTD